MDLIKDLIDLTALAVSSSVEEAEALTAKWGDEK